MQACTFNFTVNSALLLHCSLGTPKAKIDPAHKLPLKRFEPAIYRFTKIAIPTDLDRLERHKYNIEKVQMSKQIIYGIINQINMKPNYAAYIILVCKMEKLVQI